MPTISPIATVLALELIAMGAAVTHLKAPRSVSEIFIVSCIVSPIIFMVLILAIGGLSSLPKPFALHAGFVSYILLAVIVDKQPRTPTVVVSAFIAVALLYMSRDSF